jgi:hypothetical protein
MNESTQWGESVGGRTPIFNWYKFIKLHTLS